jgi:hypothetical protein
MKGKMASRMFAGRIMAAVLSLALSACSTVPSSAARRTTEAGSPKGVIAAMPPTVEHELKTQFDEYIRWKGPLTASAAISEFPADVAQSSRWRQFAGDDLSTAYWIIYELCIPGAHPDEGPVETFLMPVAVAQTNPAGQLHVFRYQEEKSPNKRPTS